MRSPARTRSVKLWRAPDVMDAVMLKGEFAGHRYPPHTHDTLCLAVITSGQVALEVGNQRRTCRRGDVVVVDADVVHSGAAGGNDQWKMRVEHVQPSALAAYCEQLGIPRRERFEPESPFILDAELSRHLVGVNWCSENDDDRFKRSEALASAIVGLSARHASNVRRLPAVSRETTLVKAVKNRLRADLQAKVTLLTLADEFHATPFVLLRAFVREAGMSPHAFQQQERVRAATLMLRAGRPIAATGAMTGFADQPHFTRVFKQQTGVTPKVYRSAFC